MSTKTQNEVSNSRLVLSIFQREIRAKVTNRANEEILVEPRNHSKIGFHEHSVHNPHNVTGTTVEGRHYQWHIRG